MLALGLPDFRPVQNNISFNEKAGTTRGIHAEPWDKFISVATGRIFGAWVDLREGPSFGAVFTAELDPGQAIFIPRGVGNAFQTLEDNTAYTYLVNDHWSADAQGQYTFLNLADETAAIAWPIPLEQAELSDKDKPPIPAWATLSRCRRRRSWWWARTASSARRCGNCTTAIPPSSSRAGRSSTWAATPPSPPGTGRTTPPSSTQPPIPPSTPPRPPTGRRTAWAVNVTAVARLARTAVDHNLILVHVSSDYVFDGTRATHEESEPSHRWACTARPKPRETPWSAWCPGTTSCAPAG